MMNKISLYLRHPLRNISAISNQCIQIRLKSTKKDDGEDSEQSAKKSPKNKEAVDKLNLLLKQMVEDDVIAKATPTLDLAKPIPKRKGAIKKEETPKVENVEVQQVDKNVVTSVKNVAESLGGNKKQTESELLSRLLSPIDIDHTVNKQMVSTTLSDVVKGMKIDRTQKKEDISRAQQVKNILQATQTYADAPVGQRTSPKRLIRSSKYTDERPREKERINLFGKEPLGIFTDVSQYTDVQINETWQKLHERELKLAVTHPPSNYFQQMILWTEQGKLWKFPIDNEQGMEEEQSIYFAEHVFLDKYLEPWCPPKGPIRHFMELVCVGLSKNPYMSVKHKQEHIEWFTNYFADKQKLLEETGAIPPNFKISSDSNVLEDGKK